jgi:hypothetical protein
MAPLAVSRRIRPLHNRATLSGPLRITTDRTQSEYDHSAFCGKRPVAGQPRRVLIPKAIGAKCPPRPVTTADQTDLSLARQRRKSSKFCAPLGPKVLSHQCRLFDCAPIQVFDLPCRSDFQWARPPCASTSETTWQSGRALPAFLRQRRVMTGGVDKLQGYVSFSSNKGTAQRAPALRVRAVLT